jgi:cytoskeletal protein RodZ
LTERIGERLRRRREELGLTLEDVSELIRYRPEIISAIEEGRTSVFPAKAYLSAFLRAYAAILELDPREIVREQKSEEERAFEAIRNIRVKPRRKRRIDRRVLYIIIPIVLAAGLLIVVDRFVWDREAGPRAVSEEVPAPAAEREQPGTEAAPGEAVVDTSAAGGDTSAARRAREEASPEEAAPSSSGPGAQNPERQEHPVQAPVPPAEDKPSGTAGQAGPPVSPVVTEAATGAGTTTGSESGAATRTGSGAESGAESGAQPQRHKLVVSARRGAYVNLRSGGRGVFEGYFDGGEVDSFYSETPFVIVALTDRGAWTFVQDGERVSLPGTSSEDVSNFVIPYGSDN